MSIKCKYADIKDVFDWYEKHGKNNPEIKALIGTSPDVLTLAWYSPSGTNWTYKLGLLEIGCTQYLIVTVFGEVKAAQVVDVPHYATLLDVKGKDEFETKAQALEKRLSYCVDSITAHTVDANWYRWNVDIDYQGEQPVEIVEVNYLSDYYGSPKHCTSAHFMGAPVEELAGEFEI